MSEAVGQPVDQDVVATLNELEGRVAELEAESERKDERIEELEEEVEHERTVREALISTRIDVEKHDVTLGSVFIAGVPFGDQYNILRSNVEELDNTVDEIEDNLNQERNDRANEDAKLFKRINAVADEADVDVTDADLMGDDKIQRVMKNGPREVVDNEQDISSAQERAAELLRNIPDWWTRVNDANGDRFEIKSPDARQHLKDKRGESLQSSQVWRAFQKVEEWGADSPRHVKADNTGDTNRLIISLEESN